ncbi:MAG: OsmC family protein [Myxococcota bacterium]
MTGTLAGALEARKVKTANNITSSVEGDIEAVDGVLRITKIRLVYHGKITSAAAEKMDKILGSYAKQCPAYQSVKGCIDVTWRTEFEVVDV